MKQIAISKFKAACLAFLEEVRKTGEPVLVTRFGKPVAEIVPVRFQPIPPRQLGHMAGTGRIVGDLIAPVVEAPDWDALQ